MQKLEVYGGHLRSDYDVHVCEGGYFDTIPEEGVYELEITPNFTQRCYGPKNLDSYSSRMVMNESYEIFEKSHLGGSGGALKLGRSSKSKDFLVFSIVIYKGKIRIEEN